MSIRKNTSKENKRNNDHEDKHDALFLNHPHPILRLDAKGYCLVVNESFQELTGLTADDLDKHYSYYIYEKDVARVEKHFQKALTGRSQEFDYIGVLEDGSLAKLNCIYVPIMENGIYVGVYATLSDITHLKEKEALQDQYTNRLNALLENSFDIVHIVDEDGNIQYENSRGKKELGDITLRPNIFNFIHHEDTNRVKKMMNNILFKNGNKQKVEARIRKKDGSWKICELYAKNLIDDPGVRGVVINYYDITSLKEVWDKLHFESGHDYLTKLPNRRMLERQIDQEIEKACKKGSQFALYFLDVDNFKYINDTLGHSIGDALLKEVSQRLINSLGPDSFIARIGGDEFAIIIRNGDQNNLNHVSNTILDVLSYSYYINEQEISITTSIGISIYDESGKDRGTLIKNAEIAMYWAKDNTENAYEYYNKNMALESFRNYLLLKDLRKAIDNNELVLHFQPVINMSSMTFGGVEALVRWNHPTLGMISPAEFIPLAEGSGEIIPIGAWVLEKACKQTKKWQDTGFPNLKVSVNFSAVQFRQKNIYQTITNILEKTMLNPSFLVLEITESTLLNQNTETLSTIARLREIGVKIAMDDFGTGYSSIMTLKNFDFDILKLDRSFIKEIETRENKLIVSAFVDLANALNLDVIVEGIETIEQKDTIISLGCKEAQGYLFSKPVAAQETEVVMRKGCS
ncbi:MULTISPECIES: EAL and GGDEF domain-containing protein [Bacillaceae]|uniref:EAL domain-containing protein n=1 Tax=Evansella alkalicola TaxID=745819 RepID=A0ABS6JTJ3_9BACI|nr:MULTISPECIES: bifunctional diguanylate cyclase/phosphodiesterase [Bacillaceae]MBU9721567.1 EAL domain-containing protein [Bacillus alkalicola]